MKPEDEISSGKYKLLPSVDKHCFGCSQHNDTGLKMRFYTDEKSVISWLEVPQHLCGWSNLIHGGVISTILDEIMSWSTLYLLKKVILTKSMNVRFLKPLFIGEKLRVEGRIRQLISEREALAEGFIYNEKNLLCANSTGKFALFTNESAKKLTFFDHSVFEEFKIIFGDSA